MGQYFLYANLTSREFFSPDRLGTDSKFICNARNNPGVMFQLLTATGLEIGTDVPSTPSTSISNAKYRALLHGLLGRWAGDVAIQIGDYTGIDSFALMLKQPESGTFRRSVIRNKNKLDQPVTPQSWIRTQYQDITPQLVSLAKAVGLVPTAPSSPFEASGDLEKYLKNRLLFDWRRQTTKPTDLRWMHPHDLEAYLGTFETLHTLTRAKTMLRGCLLEPVHQRILEHFVSPQPPHYGILYKRGTRWRYESVFADRARRMAYGDWELQPGEIATEPRRLPDPPIVFPQAKYHKRGTTTGNDQLRHLDLSGLAHEADSPDQSRSARPVDGPAAADGQAAKPQRRRRRP